jgi:hypothetical protein
MERIIGNTTEVEEKTRAGVLSSSWQAHCLEMGCWPLNAKFTSLGLFDLFPLTYFPNIIYFYKQKYFKTWKCLKYTLTLLSQILDLVREAYAASGSQSWSPCLIGLMVMAVIAFNETLCQVTMLLISGLAGLVEYIQKKKLVIEGDHSFPSHVCYSGRL